jgi:hypothetical protein
MAIWAMWFQETYVFSSGNAKLLMFFIGLVAVALTAQAVVLILMAVKAAKAAKELAATANELKARVVPLIETSMEVSKMSQSLLRETVPKVKLITDNLVETTNVARASAQKFDKTITDANLRAQRQVARVDGMVTAALTTTAEVADSITNGIKGPAQRIAVVATQAKFIAEGILDKIKSMASGSSFNRQR